MQFPVSHGVFKGDSEHLVDKLIAACEVKAAPSSAYTGFGRELVPWTDDDVAMPSVAKPQSASR